MRRLATIVAPLLFAAACTTNPITGRSQLILLDAETESRLGSQCYQQILSEVEVSERPEEVAPLQRVGERIARAAEELARERGIEMRFDWEYNVIHDPRTANAFALPGGKIAFFNGIYPIAQDENGMAVIMGHEVAHVLLRHGNERMSQQLAAQLGAVVLAVSMHDKDPQVLQAALAAYGVGVTLGVLHPWSRAQEAEADRVGLLIAARAGYDPRAGPQLWRRMREQHPSRLPEFLSTHPSHESRIRDLERMLPEAIALYERSERAPVARLPDPRAGEKARPTVVSAAASRALRESHRLAFSFRLDRDAFVRRITVSGRGGFSEVLEANVPVERGVPMRVELTPARGVPEGPYTARIEGRASGRVFETTVTLQPQ
jgi:predicted Zn-dependent protease